MTSHRNRTSTITSNGLHAVLGPFFALMLMLGVALGLRPAAAQEIWVERAKVVEELAKSHAEAPMALGVTAEGAVLELFRTADGATWTLVVTLPNGHSRVVASGEAWTTLPMQVKGRVS